ncbi:MAG: response regulator [Prolixibacteraceae bacterium]|nr:response regulator [Prolixibacteraceae bacterium]MBN2775219.1 response regulator [Prolixibacteraceae bacterium]
MRDLNVLLIEDNPADAFLIREMLNPNGKESYSVRHSVNLKDSLQLLEEENFDFIISDLELPDSYGLNTVKSVLKKIKHIPIIVLTGNDSEQIGNEAIRIGAQDYLIKGTINKNQLNRSIRYAFSRKKNENEILSYQKKLQSLVTELNLVEEKQRRKIAVELHDHLGQNLAMAKIRLAAFKSGKNVSMDENFIEIEKQISHAIDYSRILTYELSPPVLFELGLVEAVKWKLDIINKKNTITSEIRMESEIPELKENYLILIFRSFSELIDNIVNHSFATHVIVSFKIVDSLLHLEVLDNGKGFNPEMLDHSVLKSNKNGLFGTKERLGYYDGQLIVKSEINIGTKIEIIIPVISK